MKPPIPTPTLAVAGTALAALLFAAPALLLLSATRPAAFVDAFESVPLGRALLNSLWICALGVPAALAIASMAAFGLTQIGAHARNRLLVVLLLAGSIPLTAVLIPRFVLFDAAGIVGTPLPLLAPVWIGGTPLACLLLYAAQRRIAQDRIDAARLEGLGWLSVWWRVVVPLTRPTHGAVAILALLAFWGAFLEPLLYLHEESELTAPLMLHAVSLFGSTRWPLLMATATLIALPAILGVVLLSPFLRHPFQTRP